MTDEAIEEAFREGVAASMIRGSKLTTSMAIRKALLQEFLMGARQMNVFIMRSGADPVQVEKVLAGLGGFQPVPKVPKTPPINIDRPIEPL